MKKFLLIAIFASLPLLGQTCAEVSANPFPPAIVREVLQNFKIPYEAREGVVKRLHNIQPRLDVLVQKKAATLEHNPFNPPILRVAIGKIESEVNLEYFKKVLEAEGIDETRTQYEMFDQILNKRAEFIYNCRTNP